MRGRSLPRGGRLESGSQLLVTAIGIAASGLLLEAMFRGARLAGLYEFDAWSFWVPKAKAIYEFGSLDEGFFTSLPGAAYPPLVPTLDAAVFHAMGSADVVSLHAQYWLFGVGLVWALAGVLAERVAAWILWPFLLLLLLAPRIGRRLQITEADMLLDILFVLAAVLLLYWILDRQRWRLVVGTALLCGMVLTKREGLLLFAVLLAASLVASARAWRSAWPALGVSAAVVVVTAIPWRVWYVTHDIGGEGPTDGFVQRDRFDVLGPAVRRVFDVLWDPGYWNVLVPVAVGALVLAAVARVGRMAVFFATLLAFVVLGAIWATWVFSLTGEGYVVGGNFVIRFLGAAALLCVAAAPLLLSAVWDKVGSVKDGQQGGPRKAGLAAAISVARRDRMTTHALTLTRRDAADRVLAQPFLDGLFLLTIFTVTFHKLQWELAGSLTLSDVLTSVFLVLFAWDRLERDDGGFTRTAMIAFLFLLLFALVYLAGFYSLDTGQALAQWAKGMVKFVLHFGFLVTGIALLARRGLRFYWYALAAFLGGIGLDAVYGVVQLGLAEAGVNLDQILIQPITSRQTGINVFGAVGGTQEVFRPNALTGDPNHLGIELVIPLLVLTPLYLRLEAGHRLKTPLAISLAFMLLVELATLSRSALLGLGCGALILALPYRRHLKRPAFLVPLAAVAVLVATVIVIRLDFFLTVLRARTNTSRGAASPHFAVYSFVPDILSTHPFLGLGLNNFAVYYEFVTGRPDFGPHSFYVATIVETGIVGALLFAAFVVWIFRRLGAARRIGRALSAAHDPLAARIRPVAWGMTAALVATLVANVFYLTMTFYYFYVFATLAAALPVVALGARRE